MTQAIILRFLEGQWPASAVVLGWEDSKGNLVESASDYPIVLKNSRRVRQRWHSQKDLATDILVFKEGDGYRIRVSSIDSRPLRRIIKTSGRSCGAQHQHPRPARRQAREVPRLQDQARGPCRNDQLGQQGQGRRGAEGPFLIPLSAREPTRSGMPSSNEASRLSAGHGRRRRKGPARAGQRLRQPLEEPPCRVLHIKIGLTS